MMIGRAGSEPTLSSELLARIVLKLGLTARPTLDLAGLNRLYGAYSGNIAMDNLLKRIWLVGDQAKPLTGGDPSQFFENWLAHGTGGTCFPASGALCVLLRALGFDARRISGSIVREGLEPMGNHGSVLVTLEGIDYLTDAQFASFKVLPLVPGQPSSTGGGIHDLRARPTSDGFDVLRYPGSNRLEPLIMRPNLKLGPVDHDFFLHHYDLSALRDRNRSPFNDALFISRNFPGSILIIGRYKRIDVFADNSVTTTEITHDQRNRILFDALGISEAVINAMPPDDEDDGVSIGR